MDQNVGIGVSHMVPSLRDSVPSVRSPGTSVPGFHIPSLRGWDRGHDPRPGSTNESRKDLARKSVMDVTAPCCSDSNRERAQSVALVAAYPTTLAALHSSHGQISRRKRHE